MKPDDKRHGTYAGYQKKCRCGPCRTAATEYTRAWRARNRGTLPDGDPRHGTVTGHDDYGCRCNPCRAAHFRALGNYYLRLAKKFEAKERIDA